MSSPVPLFDVVGLMNAEEEQHKDMFRPGIPAWRLHDIIDYFTSRGFDRILVERRGSVSYLDVPRPDQVA